MYVVWCIHACLERAVKNTTTAKTVDQQKKEGKKERTNERLMDTHSLHNLFALAIILKRGGEPMSTHNMKRNVQDEPDAKRQRVYSVHDAFDSMSENVLEIYNAVSKCFTTLTFDPLLNVDSILNKLRSSLHDVRCKVGCDAISLMHYTNMNAEMHTKNMELNKQVANCKYVELELKWKTQECESLRSERNALSRKIQKLHTTIEAAQTFQIDACVEKGPNGMHDPTCVQCDEPLGHLGESIELSVQMGVLPWCVDCEGSFHPACFQFDQVYRKPVCYRDKTDVVAGLDEVWQCSSCRIADCMPLLHAHTCLLDVLVAIVTSYI